MSFIIDPEVNKWISNYDLEKDTHILNTILNIGYNVLKITKVQVNDNSAINGYLINQEKIINSNVDLIKEKIINHDKFLDMRLYSMEHTINNLQNNSNKIIETQNNKFNELIENITGKTHTSATKGKIAEVFLEKALQDLYPDDVVLSTGQESHEGDIQLISDNHPTILIESKNYSHTVPTKEVEKFKNDLNRTNILYGIFFSFGSSITGKSKFQIENYNDKFILYLPSIKFDITTVALAVMIMQKIASLNNGSVSIDKNIVSQKANEILIILKDLDILYENLSKTKFELVKHKRIILDSIDQIHSAYIDNEAIIRNIIQSIKRTINDKLSQLTTDVPTPTNTTIVDTINTIDLTKLIQTGTKLDRLLFQFLSQIYDLFTIVENDTNYQLFKNMELIADICPKKTCIKINLTKIDTQFNIVPGKTADIDIIVAMLKQL